MLMLLHVPPLMLLLLTLIVLLHGPSSAGANKQEAPLHARRLPAGGTVAAAADAVPPPLANFLVDGGCLYQRKLGWKKKRVCSSADEGTPHARLGYCRKHPSHLDDGDNGDDDNGEDDDDGPAGDTTKAAPEMFDYQEIRISSQNWESSFYITWILQVVLSEILDVPTSVETGLAGVVVDFYDRDGRTEYGIINDEEALRRGVQVGDCRPIVRAQRYDGPGDNKSDKYESCSHFIPEVWDAEELKVDDFVRQGLIETPQSMGVIGQENWFIPKFTAERDPTLLSYVGLAGEENRRKLAKRFGRPVRWGDYCKGLALANNSSRSSSSDSSSSNNNNGGNSSSSTSTSSSSPPCTDAVSMRAPADDEEADAFFVEGLYAGHFRHDLDENNCTKYPNNCTGHIIDYPCGWTSFVIPQTHHLGIALQSSGNEPGSRGYTYPEMIQILLASNYTKSDIIVFWWTPEVVSGDYVCATPVQA